MIKPEVQKLLDEAQERGYLIRPRNQLGTDAEILWVATCLGDCKRPVIVTTRGTKNSSVGVYHVYEESTLPHDEAHALAQRCCRAYAPVGVDQRTLIGTALAIPAYRSRLFEIPRHLFNPVQWMLTYDLLSDYAKTGRTDVPMTCFDDINIMIHKAVSAAPWAKDAEVEFEKARAAVESGTIEVPACHE